MCGVWKHNLFKMVMGCAEEFNKATGYISTDRLVNRRHRSVILNFHLNTHPLDCPICDQASECDLQEITFHRATDLSVRVLELPYSINSFTCNSLVKATMTRCIYVLVV